MHILCQFKLDNLKILFLNANNLISLNFIEKFKCDNLEEIWLNDNKLEEFQPLVKYKNLNRIELNNNKINNINNLYIFVNSFVGFKKISIKGNTFKLNEDNNKILEFIKKEGKIKIVYNNINY